MKLFSDIMVPLDGSATALKSLGIATWLASRLGARVHILNAGGSLHETQALARLGVPEKYWPLIEVRQAQGEAVDEILAAVERYHVGLLVMTAHGESIRSAPPDCPEAVGQVTRVVIERSQTPVLVLPTAYEESLPWRSALVPLSDEAATDESLTLALQLANALDLDVAVAHITDGALHERDEATRRYADQVHHELGQMLNELVARACPLCTAEERSRIEDFHLARGDTAEELLHLIEHKRVSLLVIGWHGDFTVGHAQVLKRLMRRIRCPLLLVKPQPKESFRLKVGEAFG
jgi:nucleotide-binding universal stress UspA family protein